MAAIVITTTRCKSQSTHTYTPTEIETCIVFLLSIKTQMEVWESFFESSQTFMSVSISQEKHGEYVFYFYQKIQQQKSKQLV